MEKLPRAEYSPEFREQAVRTYQGSGLSVAEVAKRLSLLKPGTADSCQLFLLALTVFSRSISVIGWAGET